MWLHAVVANNNFNDLHAGGIKLDFFTAFKFREPLLKLLPENHFSTAMDPTYMLGTW